MGRVSGRVRRVQTCYSKPLSRLKVCPRLSPKLVHSQSNPFASRSLAGSGDSLDTPRPRASAEMTTKSNRPSRRPTMSTPHTTHEIELPTSRFQPPIRTAPPHPDHERSVCNGLRPSPLLTSSFQISNRLSAIRFPERGCIHGLFICEWLY